MVTGEAVVVTEEIVTVVVVVVIMKGMKCGLGGSGMGGMLEAVVTGSGRSLDTAAVFCGSGGGGNGI